MPNEITAETLREWAAEADEGEEIVLGAKELRGLAEDRECLELEVERLSADLNGAY